MTRRAFSTLLKSKLNREKRWEDVDVLADIGEVKLVVDSEQVDEEDGKAVVLNRRRDCFGWSGWQLVEKGMVRLAGITLYSRSIDCVRSGQT